MKIIVFQGLQNGVGTSSICSATAYDLSKLGHCVLCLDADFLHMHSVLDCIFNIDHKGDGWIQMAMEGKSVVSYPLYLVDDCNFIPRGQRVFCAKEPLAAIIQNAISAIKQLERVDFVLIDAGVCGSSTSQCLQTLADLVITVVCPDTSSLISLDECVLSDNEFIVLNKLLNASNVMRDVCMMLHHSALSEHVLKERIAFDEMVMKSLLKRQPFTRYVPQCSSSSDIRKLSFRLIEMCHLQNGGGAQ